VRAVHLDAVRIHFLGDHARLSRLFLIKAVMDLLREGCFSRGDREVFRPLMDSLLYHDPYLLMADFRAYLDCQGRVDEAYRDKEQWTRMSILNVARSGKFSSDRTIREYCDEIWKVQPVRIGLMGRKDFLGGMGQ